MKIKPGAFIKKDITEGVRSAIHKTLRDLANCTNFKKVDGLGFNRHDQDKGSDLAYKDRLTDDEAHEAKRILEKYSEQIDSETYQIIFE